MSQVMSPGPPGRWGGGEMLDIEFHHVANYPADHTYVMRPQYKLGTVGSKELPG